MTASERWARLVARKKKEGLKRLWIWARPEDVAALQEATLQPGALARLRDQALAKVKAEVSAELEAQLKRTPGKEVPAPVLAALEGNAEAMAAFSRWLAELVHAVAEGGDAEAAATGKEGSE